MHQEVGVPRRGWRRKKPDKKDVGNDDDNGERSHCATSRVGRGSYLSVRSVSGCQVMTRDSCPTLEGGSSSVKWVPVIS